MKVALEFTCICIKVSAKRWPTFTITDNRATTFIFFSWYSNWPSFKWIKQTEQERLFGLGTLQTLTFEKRIKCIVILQPWGPVQTYPLLFENGYFFSGLALAVHSYPVKTVTDNASVKKRPPECRFLKTLASSLLVNGRKRRFSNTICIRVLFATHNTITIDHYRKCHNIP